MISDESIRVDQIPLLLHHFHLAEVVLVVREPIAWITSAARQILKSRGGRNQLPESVVSGLYRGKSWNPETQVRRIANSIAESLVAQNGASTKTSKEQVLVDFLSRIRLFAYEAADFSPSNVMCSVAGGHDHLSTLANVHLNSMAAKEAIPIEIPPKMRRLIKKELEQTQGLVSRCMTSADTLATIASYSTN